MTAIVETIDLVKRYGRTTVLDGFALAVEPGSVYALVGPNGAGKTTTIKILMNIIEPNAGRARVLGVDSRQIGPAEFQRIGYVSENQEVPGWMTVGYLMRYLEPFYPGWDRQRADDLLRQFELPLDRKLKHLSRGMRMKAALASSLAYRPALLVLDEPFSGLDPLVRDEFVEGLVEIAEETTILVSSHDLAEIENLATHVGFLDKGRLQFSERLSDLSERYREVQVTLAGAAPAPSGWPASWLAGETAGSIVRFVESAFDRDRTLSDVHRVFGAEARVETTAMSLRAIFVTMARQARRTAA